MPDGTHPPEVERQPKKKLSTCWRLNEEFHLSMSFDIGDIQILNSHVTMHSHTPYEDWPDADKKRRLWQVWLKNPDFRPRPEAFRHRVQGIIAPDTRPRVVL